MPAPVSTTAATVRSDQADLKAKINSSTVRPRNEFIRSGRLISMIATALVNRVIDVRQVVDPHSLPFGLDWPRLQRLRSHALPWAPMNPRDILSRPATPPDFTVAYGDHPDHIADVRRPAVEAGLPLVIFIHGGFWMAEFDRTHAGPLAVALAELGYPVATLEYRRVGGGGGWPTTFDDVAAGVAGVPRRTSPGPMSC